MESWRRRRNQGRKAALDSFPSTTFDNSPMYPSSHDCTMSNIQSYMVVLHKLLKAGNKVVVVTKPRFKCVKLLCQTFQDYRDSILFRFTMGSVDDTVLKFWEPNAPSFRERLKSLRWAYEHGYRTSVSLEPLLDDRVDGVLAKVKPFVTDSIWIGRANRLRSIISLNCPRDAVAREKAEALIALHSDQWIRGLYNRYKRDKIIYWKDSVRNVVGLPPYPPGLDV